MTYEELEEYANQLLKEREQARADYADAKQALVGVKSSLLRKLNQARLVSRCEQCPLWKEETE
ncbi:hypothetical protein UFOVP1037_23 [uncultured Caudovirales phage]|uniref:Uncharacterized protein n=1 Tax=uncultured Caudovirales phage TaxID=2100421 RepID=A0A6J5LM28_9CAUD|nr:hypothetical protein UFOVP287_28 [uncultured Caudovirales phage]CAB4174071.1 hypothetical protein UFOVP969_24 [uncultured Caudovirales phage]CAB4180419.1 hypothetical protein UFOVP1037_23 [uncultured Caudovirales phage]CAB4194007.1 hypothetical protein UFOVP1250_25 [uncultured Caudovirales phage]